MLRAFLVVLFSVATAFLPLDSVAAKKKNQPAKVEVKKQKVSKAKSKKKQEVKKTTSKVASRHVDQDDDDDDDHSHRNAHSGGRATAAQPAKANSGLGQFIRSQTTVKNTGDAVKDAGVGVALKHAVRKILGFSAKGAGLGGALAVGMFKPTLLCPMEAPDDCD